MQRWTITIHPEAPAKPALGAPCNGCGLCCLAEPCPLGMLVSRRRNGACAALRWVEPDHAVVTEASTADHGTGTPDEDTAATGSAAIAATGTRSGACADATTNANASATTYASASPNASPAGRATEPVDATSTRPASLNASASTPGGGRYVCGLVHAPQDILPAALMRHAPGPGGLLALGLRRFAQRCISAGSGCDAALEVQPPHAGPPDA